MKFLAVKWHYIGGEMTLYWRRNGTVTKWDTTVQFTSDWVVCYNDNNNRFRTDDAGRSRVVLRLGQMA